MTGRRAKLSKPGEHGGLVTLGGSSALVTLAAPEPVTALAASSIFALAYLARGPVERMARGFRLREWDRAGLGAYALVAVAAAVFVAHGHAAVALVTLGSALCIPLIGAAVSRARVHRTFIVELCGMAGCGGSAGIALHAGGAPGPLAGAAGLAMACYAAAAVAMVRAQVRDLDSAGRLWRSRAGLLILVAGAAGAGLVRPELAVAFAPRLGHAAWRSVRVPGEQPIAVIATRETAELAVFVAVLAVGLMGGLSW